MTFRPTALGILQVTLIYTAVLAPIPVILSLGMGLPGLAVAYPLGNILVIGGLYAVLTRAGRLYLRLTDEALEVAGVLRTHVVPWIDIDELVLRERVRQVWIRRRSDRGTEPVVVAAYLFGMPAPELHGLLTRQLTARTR